VKFRLHRTLRLGPIRVHLTERGLPAKFWLDVRYQRALAAADVEILETLIADLEAGVVSWSEDTHGEKTSWNAN